MKIRAKTPAKAKPASQKEAGSSASKGKPRERSSWGGGSTDNLDDDALMELVPGGMAQAFVRSKMHDKAVAIAGLGEPSDWEGDMPELPNDIGTMDHDDLSNLHAQFTNAYSTSIWWASKNYVEADAYEEMKDYLLQIALADAKGSNDTQRKAAALTDDRVVAAESLRRQRYRDYVRFRDLANTLDKRARAVSRIGGFIGDEAEHEDTRPARDSTRGKALGRSRGTSKGSAKRLSRR